jgi:hypothetical protein
MTGSKDEKGAVSSLDRTLNLLLETYKAATQLPEDSSDVLMMVLDALMAHQDGNIEKSLTLLGQARLMAPDSSVVAELISGGASQLLKSGEEKAV